MTTIPKSNISSYLNQTVVLVNASVVSEAPINVKVRWEDVTKEIVDLTATYQPINAVVSCTLLILFTSAISYYFWKDGVPFLIKQIKMIPGVDGTVDYYQYFVIKTAAP